jgi:hypothetical protein
MVGYFELCLDWYLIFVNNYIWDDFLDILIYISNFVGFLVFRNLKVYFWFYEIFWVL